MSDLGYIIGVDPGTTTGIVVWDNTQRQIMDQFAGTPYDSLAYISSLLCAWVVDMKLRPIIVCERFDLSADTLRKNTGENLDDVIHVVGALWYVTQAYQVEYHKVARADSKNFAKDARLKHHGLWLGSRHTRDALRVVMTWLAQKDNSFAREYWAN